MIRRSPSQTRQSFTIMPNATLNDSRLSWEAKGMLAYLISKPDHWQVRVSHLVKESPNAKKRRVLTILDELETLGYITNNGQRFTEAGDFSYVERIVHEISVVPSSVHANSVHAPSVHAKAHHIVSTDLEQVLIEVNTDRSNLSSPENSGDSGASEPPTQEPLSADFPNLPLSKFREPLAMANLLADLIYNNDQRISRKRPKIQQKWLEEIEKLHRIDGYSYSEISEVIRWCQNDPFWQSNILSGQKLRLKFSTLYSRSGNQPRQSTTFSDIEAFLNNGDL